MALNLGQNRESGQGSIITRLRARREALKFFRRLEDQGSSTDREILEPVLSRIDVNGPGPSDHIAGWRISPLEGGTTGNKLFLAVNSSFRVVIKFFLNSDRAAREYAALLALDSGSSSIAPKPILFNRLNFRLPVVVQSFLEGETSYSLPANSDEWNQLLIHYAALHRTTPNKAPFDYPAHIFSTKLLEQSERLILRYINGSSDSTSLDELDGLLSRLARRNIPARPTRAVSLCRGDANLLNFVRRPSVWASVDWEMSGWGDPALDIASLLTHPTALAISSHRREWVIRSYAGLFEESEVAERIRFYIYMLVAYWIIRYERMISANKAQRDKSIRDRKSYKSYLLLAREILR